MTRISVDDARTLWLEASDDDLKRLAEESPCASTSPIAPRTW